MKIPIQSSYLECPNNTGKIAREQNISEHLKSPENIVKEFFFCVYYNYARLNSAISFYKIFGVISWKRFPLPYLLPLSGDLCRF